MTNTSIKEILDTFTLITEGYDDRVAQFVGDITSNGPVELTAFVDQMDIVGNPLERRLGITSTAWKDFKKDAIAHARRNNLIKRKTVYPYWVEKAGSWGNSKIRISNEDIARLARKMVDLAGEVFPDGDPNDQLQRYFAKNNWDIDSAYSRLVPVSCKKHLGVSTYNQYLADMWDDVYQDRLSDYENHKDNKKIAIVTQVTDALRAVGGLDAKNPWT